MVSHELGNIRTSSNIEAVTIEAIKSESQLVTKKLHRVLTRYTKKKSLFH